MTTNVNNLPTKGSHNSLSGCTFCVVMGEVPPYQVKMTSNIMAQARDHYPFPLSRAMLSPLASNKAMPC